MTGKRTFKIYGHMSLMVLIRLLASFIFPALLQMGHTPYTPVSYVLGVLKR